MYVFFPNPSSDRLKFPLEYGQSLTTEERRIDVTLDCMGKKIEMNLVFKPYQSLLYKIENGEAESVDIEFIPKTPSVKHRPEGYKAPWLVDLTK